MNNRLTKLLALMLVLMLTLSGCSMIVIDEEKDNAQTAALVGGEIITKGEAQSLYDYFVDYYTAMNSYYGLNSGLDLDELKQQALDALVQQKLVAQKAAELGLDQLSDEQKAEVETKAGEQFESYITNYQGEVKKDGMTEEEIRTATIDFLAENGITLDVLVGDETAAYVANLVREYAVADVTLTDEELTAAYDEAVAADQKSYEGSAYLYEYYKTNGNTVYWNPEGYRTVKHILFLLSDEQSGEISQLTTELTDLQSRLDALENPTEDAENTEDTEEAAETLTADELNQMIADKEQEIEAKKAEILASYDEKVEAVKTRYEAGERFDDLMAELGEDPGMKSEPAMTNGYVVSADSVMWEAAFTEHAMAIENVGDLSEAFLGSNGVHIICYTGDVTPGAVAIEEVKDELSETELTDKQNEVYNAAYEGWLAAANVKTYPKVLDEHSHDAH